MADGYTVYNRRCGHVVGVAMTREPLETFLRALPIVVAAPMRIRIGTTDDIAANVQGIRCNVCTLDGKIVMEASR